MRVRNSYWMIMFVVGLAPCAHAKEEVAVQFDLVTHLQNDPHEITQMIYESNASVFIGLNPHAIADKFLVEITGAQVDLNVARYLRRIDTVSELVRQSLNHDRREEIIAAWKDIAVALLNKNDYFGYACVALGLRNLYAGSIFDVDDIITLDITRRSVYVSQKNVHKDEGMVPMLVHEGAQLLHVSYGHLMHEGDALTQVEIAARLEPVKSDFVADIVQMQRTLREKLQRSGVTSPYNLEEILRQHSSCQRRYEF